MSILNPWNLNLQVRSSFSTISHHYHQNMCLKLAPIRNPNCLPPPFPSIAPSMNPQKLACPTASFRFTCTHSSPIWFPNTSPLGFRFCVPSSSPVFNLLLHISNGLNDFKSDTNDAGFFHWHKAPRPISGESSRFLGDGQKDVTAVLLGWLGAKPKHLKRYAELYTSEGINAITFVVPVRDALRFDSGRKVDNQIKGLAAELVSWLLKSEIDGRERGLIFHTFSNTGWLVYGSILNHFRDRSDLLKKIRGCVVDSGADPELNPKVWAAGFSAALLKKRNSSVNPVDGEELKSDTTVSEMHEKVSSIAETILVSVLEKLFSIFLNLPDINQRLSEIVWHLLENQPYSPQLYLYSTADKIISAESVESFIRHQQKRGRTVWSYNFETSPHVDHYRTFPSVYSSKIHSFLDECLGAAKRL